jgi:threonine-phosphate decarboxylase
MNEFEHGGNVYTAAKEAGCDIKEIIDLSSNISPYIHKDILKKLQDMPEMLGRLPEPDSESLVRTIIDKHELNDDTIVAGSGTTEFIHKLTQIFRGENALVVQPTYVDYIKYAKLAKMEIRNVVMPESNGFAFDDGELLSYMDKTSLCFICNPNNPTGSLVCKDELRFLADMFKKTTFLVDESYIDFSTERYPSLIGCSLPNVVVLRSFSKSYGIPGLRAGYMYSSNIALIDIVKEIIPEWSVSTPAQEICKIALETDISNEMNRVNETKKFTIDLLSEVKNIKVIDSNVNFFLLKLSKSNAPDFCKYMLSHKILVRDCSNITGLSDKFVRVAVKTEDEMNLFCKLTKLYFDIF